MPDERDDIFDPRPLADDEVQRLRNSALVDQVRRELDAWGQDFLDRLDRLLQSSADRFQQVNEEREREQIEVAPDLEAESQFSPEQVEDGRRRFFEAESSETMRDVRDDVRVIRTIQEEGN